MNTSQSVRLSRQQFWTGFGQYMRPVPSASGEKINWVNYKTGIKFIRIAMDCSNGKAMIALELLNPDTLTRHAQYEQLFKLKKQFQQICGNSWSWQKDGIGAGQKNISLISASIENVHLLNQHDWSEIITFFKERLILMDQFWNAYQFALQ